MLVWPWFYFAVWLSFTPPLPTLEVAFSFSPTQQAMQVPNYRAGCKATRPPSLTLTPELHAFNSTVVLGCLDCLGCLVCLVCWCAPVPRPAVILGKLSTSRVLLAEADAFI